MKQYFTNDPDREPNRREITFWFRGKQLHFISDDGVFSKETLDFGSRLLLEATVDLDLKGRLLDLGCGLGYLGILLKIYHPELSVSMSDVNETAVALAKENSVLHRQDNVVFAADGIPADTEYDYIVTNPPIRTGKENVHRLLLEAYEHLVPNGRMYFVIQKKQGAQSALSFMLTQGAAAEIVARKSGYWVIEAAKNV